MLVGQVERKDFGRLALQEQNYQQAAGRHHQIRHRGQRTRTGLRSHRPRLPCRRKRHPGPGRRHPAGRHLRRSHRRRTQPAQAARHRRPAHPGPAAARRHAGQVRTAADPGRRRPAGRQPARQAVSTRTCSNCPNNGCCPSTPPTAARNCSTPAIPTTAATWASASRPR